MSGLTAADSPVDSDVTDGDAVMTELTVVPDTLGAITICKQQALMSNLTTLLLQ